MISPGVAYAPQLPIHAAPSWSAIANATPSDFHHQPDVRGGGASAPSARRADRGGGGRPRERDSRVGRRLARRDGGDRPSSRVRGRAHGERTGAPVDRRGSNGS